MRNLIGLLQPWFELQTHARQRFLSFALTVNFRTEIEILWLTPIAAAILTSRKSQLDAIGLRKLA